MSETKRQIQLHPAYEWTCDDCGASHVFRIPARTLSEDEIRELLIESGELEEWQETPDGLVGEEFYGVPASVVCTCGSEFEALTPEGTQ